MSRVIIGIMGPSVCDAATYEKARALGRGVAEAGWVLLCGGGSGAMEGAARGAREAGGLTIGILPGSDEEQSPPNAYIDLPLYTGLSHARNLMNVLSARVVVAVGGAYGTLSEIALALRCDKPVVLLDSWSFSSPGLEPSPLIVAAADVPSALAAVRRLLAGSDLPNA